MYDKLTLWIVAANNTAQKIKTFITACVHFSNKVYCENNNVKEIYIDCDKTVEERNSIDFVMLL